MNELKECPLCGGKAQFENASTGSRHNNYTKGYRIVCNKCKLYTKSVIVDFGYTPQEGCWAKTDELDELISKWNTRV